MTRHRVTEFPFIRGYIYLDGLKQYIQVYSLAADNGLMVVETSFHDHCVMI